MDKAAIHIIHEYDAWIEPLIGFLKEVGVPYKSWFINEGKLDLDDIPPEGVFYNRMSASSHTRDHRYAIEFAESTLSWLELHDRRVINDRRALTLEVRKSEQLLALKRFGIPAPKSIVVNNYRDLLIAAEELNMEPFIIKPNRGGKGTGVKLYNNIGQLKRDIEEQQVPETLDGILIVQQYVKPVNGRITRVEFIGGKFYYAVSVDATGGFELCPADVCQADDLFCPADSNDKPENTEAKFKIIQDYQNNDLDKYAALLKANGVKIGAVEYVEGSDGKKYVYDINTNTNYNSGAEAVINNELQGMRGIAEFLTKELHVLYGEEVRV